MINVLNSRDTEYVSPTSDLLTDHPVKHVASIEESERIARELVDGMATNGFTVSLAENGITVGGSVTEYRFVPDPKARINIQIDRLENIAGTVTLQPVRGELCSKNGGAIALEIPNLSPSVLSFKETVESEEFKNAGSSTAVCLGKTVEGELLVADIANMPHALIAGNTRSGKSVALSTMLLSLIWRTSPEKLKLILLDPKRVEFTEYKTLPHLAMSVVEDTQTAINALTWVVGEINRRYGILEDNRVRNMEEYEKLTENAPKKEKLPYLVIMIDELAEYMMSARNVIEPLICTVSSKGRAVGVHMMISTQRPAVNVVTGMIKSNLPTRIAMRVAEKTDARNVGVDGADKLSGNGDMLYSAPGRHPVRVQGAYVSSEEIRRVVQFVTEKNGAASFDPAVLAQLDAVKPLNKKECDPTDALLRDAIRIAVEEQKATASLLQRKLNIGYNRAVKLLDCMLENGIIEVGSEDNPLPYKTVMTPDQLEAWLKDN